jgi:glycerol-3-phosphate dehydrogenase
VHGGVRYLAQGNISLVREALHERGLLARNAPHVVWPLGFVVPAYQMFDQPFYGIGLKLYDMLAGGLNLSAAAGSAIAKRSRPRPPGRARGRAPLRGGNLYFDGQFDDARLAMALMRTLFDVGGTAVNYMRVSGLSQSNGVITGVTAQDVIGGETFHLRADCVINATGVWVDAVRQMEDGQARRMVAPSQGVHLTIPRSFLPGDRAVLIPKTDDGRVLFLVPWNGHTIVGTTDTPRQDLPLEPALRAMTLTSSWKRPRATWPATRPAMT